MATIAEDYVSFKTAKLLKEKGFPQEYDIYHLLVYNEEDYIDEYEIQRMVLETKLVKAGTLSSYPIGVPEPKCYCPTLQMAMKWLREVHNLVIQIELIDFLEHGEVWFYSIIERKTIKQLTCKDEDFTEHSYEEACEIAIKYCLKNLI